VVTPAWDDERRRAGDCPARAPGARRHGGRGAHRRADRATRGARRASALAAPAPAVLT
jgi:hypothetical protein